MARLEPRALLAKLVRDLEERREGYLADLANRLASKPDSLTTKGAAALAGRFRECSEALDALRDGVARLA